jgi:hypothetical protein
MNIGEFQSGIVRWRLLLFQNIFTVYTNTLAYLRIDHLFSVITPTWPSESSNYIKARNVVFYHKPGFVARYTISYYSITFCTWCIRHTSSLMNILHSLTIMAFDRLTQCWRLLIAQCATYYHHMIFATTMNIASDLLLICIPILLIIKANLPVKRKVILVCILCLGVFNVSPDARPFSFLPWVCKRPGYSDSILTALHLI